MNPAIDRNILNKEKEFYNYITSLFTTREEKYFWNSVLDYSYAYVFGGVIKDYVLGIKKDHRDIDIVVEKISEDLMNRIEKYLIKKNQFDGLKLKVGNKIIDLWQIDRTWAIRTNTSLNAANYVQHLPSTSFFNITAIIFSIKDRKFISDKKFNNFLRDRTLTIVYEDNPFPGLCIIKTYEFYKTLNLKLSDPLKDYIIKYFENYAHTFKDIQLKHYDKEVYSNNELNEFYKRLVLSRTIQSKKINYHQNQTSLQPWRS